MRNVVSVLRLGVAIFLGAAVILAAGCASSGEPDPSAEPLFGLHTPNTTVTMGDTRYRLSTSSSADPERPGIDILVVTLDWESSDPTDGRADIDIAAYAADGTPRVEPAGYEPPGGSLGESRSSEEGSSGSENRAFSVREGETGVVVSVAPQGQPDLRWLVR